MVRSEFLRRHADSVLERTPTVFYEYNPNGSIVLSAIVNQTRFTRVFYGYSKQAATRIFKAYIRNNF